MIDSVSLEFTCRLRRNRCGICQLDHTYPLSRRFFPQQHLYFQSLHQGRGSLQPTIWLVTGCGSGTSKQAHYSISAIVR